MQLDIGGQRVGKVQIKGMEAEEIAGEGCKTTGESGMVGMRSSRPQTYLPRRL